MFSYVQNQLKVNLNLKVLTSPKTKKVWPILSKDIDLISTNSNPKGIGCESGQTAIDTEIGNAIFEAIERGGIMPNTAQAKKKKSKKGTVLFATGLTFEHGK